MTAIDQQRRGKGGYELLVRVDSDPRWWSYPDWFPKYHACLARSGAAGRYSDDFAAEVAAHILKLVAASWLVVADETPWRLQRGGKGYIWTFIAGKFIADRFSPSPSGDTPAEVLGCSPGTLLVDQFTGPSRARRRRRSAIVNVTAGWLSRSPLPRIRSALTG